MEEQNEGIEISLTPRRNTRGKDNEKKKRELKVGWTEEEDALLTAGVAKHGSLGTSWAKIALLFGGARCSKQCRERWTEYIDPAYNRGKFTPEEDALLLEIQPQYGNRWKDISRHLNLKFQLRSSTRIKCRWTQLQRQRKKQLASTEQAVPPPIEPKQPLIHFTTKAKESQECSLKKMRVENLPAPVAVADIQQPPQTYLDMPLYSPAAPNSAPPSMQMHNAYMPDYPCDLEAVSECSGGTASHQQFEQAAFQPSYLHHPSQYLIPYQPPMYYFPQYPYPMQQYYPTHVQSLPPYSETLPTYPFYSYYPHLNDANDDRSDDSM